jgi:hypothetical protein
VGVLYSFVSIFVFFARNDRDEAQRMLWSGTVVIWGLVGCVTLLALIVTPIVWLIDYVEFGINPFK